jgi:HlyD family secretion protein
MPKEISGENGAGALFFHPKKRRMVADPRRLLLLVGLWALLTGGCQAGNAKEKYRTQPVKRLTLEEKVVANGTVNPVTTVLVGSQVSGKIVEIFVDYNSVVKRGQMVAKIDPRLFEAKVAETRARHQQTLADLTRARANLADARNDYHRYQRLWQDNLVARDDLDNAHTRYQSEQANVKAAQAQAASAAAALKEAETNLGYTAILSPVDGVVISRNVDVGQTVAASFQTPTLFTIAQDLTKMQVETAVDEGEVGKVKEGQEAAFTVDAYPGTTFRGTVTSVRLAPQTVQNVVTYTVVVSADNPDFLLRPGMTATVSILAARKEQVLAVPNAALRFLPAPGEGPPAPGGTVVWRLERGTLKPLAITTGISDGVWTEVRQGDLTEGQPLVVGALEERSRPAVPRGAPRGPF